MQEVLEFVTTFQAVMISLKGVVQKLLTYLNSPFSDSFQAWGIYTCML